MASESEYYSAFARVEAGTASRNDLELTQRASHNTGSFGNAARRALEKADRFR